MKNYIIYNQDGKIQRTGSCPENVFSLQAMNGDFVMEGKADDATQKIEFDGFDEEGQPINPKIVDKTPEEIKADNPMLIVMPFEKRSANITNEQLQNILNRLSTLETKK